MKEKMGRGNPDQWALIKKKIRGPKTVEHYI